MSNTGSNASLRRAADHHIIMATIKPYPKPAPKPKAKKRQPKSRRQLAKARCVKLVADIVKWRDGYTCVQAESDPQHCWGVPTDGHVIVRDEYGVTYNLLNNHCQCQGHNNWHRYHSRFYDTWFQHKFGYSAWEYLNKEADKVQTEKSISTVEIEELAEKLQALWDDRPAVYDFDWLIELGYYGEWLKEHLRLG